jgi:hypothetical protein
MRVRPLVLWVVLLGAALGAVGCSSSGTSDPGTSSTSSSTGSSPGGNASAAAPGGTVTVKSGGKVICVITLDKTGTGTCKVSTKNYTPGKVTFTGAYSGSVGFKSGSGTTTLTVQSAAKKSS